MRFTVNEHHTIETYAHAITSHQLKNDQMHRVKVLACSMILGLEAKIWAAAAWQAIASKRADEMRPEQTARRSCS